MTDQFYIRIRGRVQGPFDSEKLRGLARRGQFSRLYEVSRDGQTWQPAKDFPELFAAPAAQVAQPAAAQTTAAPSAASSKGNSASSGGGYSLQSPAPQNATSAATWYYAYQGREQGPIDFNTLASMFSSRQLAPETEVWSQGMINWTQAQNVPGLVPPQAPTKSSMGVSSYSTESVRSETEQVSAATIRALTDSRPWVAFIAIIGFLYALLTLLSGVFQLIVGARSGVFPVTASGLTTIVMSLVIAFGAWLLVSFGSAISNVERSRREASLVRALSTLKSFWVYIGVVLIVILTFVILGVILVISVAGTIAGSFPELD